MLKLSAGVATLNSRIAPMLPVFFMMGPESCATLVLDLGWTQRQWAGWTAGWLNRELFGDD